MLTNKGIFIAAALMINASTIQAQSTLSLSGIVDVSIRHAVNGKNRLTGLASGGNSTSRIIFTGIEDLGGGLRAGFWLESTFFADSGTPTLPTGLTFDYRSTVSLIGGFGEVRAGRDWTPVFLGHATSDPFAATGIGSMTTFLTAGASATYKQAFGIRPSTLSRSSNTVEYWLPPNLGGFFGQVMHSFDEKSAEVDPNASGNYKYQGFRLGYRVTDLNFSVYGGQTRIDTEQRNLTQRGFSGGYRFGNGTRVSGAITESSFLNSRQRHMLLGIEAPFNQWVFKAAYNKLDQYGTDAKGHNLDSDDAEMLSLGIEYFFSKSTIAYVTVADLRNRGAAAFNVIGSPATPAQPGARSRGIDFGLRTRF